MKCASQTWDSPSLLVEHGIALYTPGATPPLGPPRRPHRTVCLLRHWRSMDMTSSRSLKTVAQVTHTERASEQASVLLAILLSLVNGTGEVVY